MADYYLPITVFDLPIDQMICGQRLRPDVRSYVDQGVVRVLAGPTKCHVVVDIRRPYNRPKSAIMITRQGSQNGQE